MRDSDLTDTICRELGAIEGWEYRETGTAYDSSVVAVWYGAIEDTPHRAAGVRVYGTTDPRQDESPSSRRVQLRLRGDPFDRAGADDLADEALSVLTGLSRMHGISDVSRLSMTPLGADTNGRQERTENYLIIFDNPEASP